MSDYTPTTEDIRAAYENRAVIGPPAMAANYEEAEAQFNRWLASVRAGALREAADWLDGFEGPGGREALHDRVGRDIIARLRDRALKIEKGPTNEHRG